MRLTNHFSKLLVLGFVGFLPAFSFAEEIELCQVPEGEKNITLSGYVEHQFIDLTGPEAKSLYESLPGEGRPTVHNTLAGTAKYFKGISCMTREIQFTKSSCVDYSCSILVQDREGVKF